MLMNDSFVTTSSPGPQRNVSPLPKVDGHVTHYMGQAKQIKNDPKDVVMTIHVSIALNQA